jgi:hypothetical protein
LGILLGPYRNLTTLTAAVLALHPQVQVLNHAYRRLRQTDGVDFFAEPTAETFDRFLALAMEISAGGERGGLGGSILFSHAFDDASLRERYWSRFGASALKPSPACMVWKDSLRVQQRLEAAPAELHAVIQRLRGVRFLLPVRQPLACALSNLRTGKSDRLKPESNDLPGVLDAVLKSIAWVLQQRDRWPDHFLVFTEASERSTLAIRLQALLGVTRDTRWESDFIAAFAPRVAPVDPALKATEQRKIAAVLAPWPDVRDALLD